jgi:hypothetical protein
MTEQPQDKSMRDSVLAAIETGKVTMRPKWHFVLQWLLLLVGVMLALLTAVYFFSFVIFMMHQTGVWYAPTFGVRGVVPLLSSLPWLMVGVAIAFVFLLDYLVKRYAFAYGKPLLYTTLGIIVLVSFAGAIVAQTPMHKELFMQARDNQLPVAGTFYRSYNQEAPTNISIGKVTQVNDAGFNIEEPRERMVFIMINDGTEFPPAGRGSIMVDDMILVLGEREQDIIKARAIKEIEGQDKLFIRKLPNY